MLFTILFCLISFLEVCNQKCKAQCSFTEYKIHRKFATFPSKEAYAHKWILPEEAVNKTDFAYWRESGYEIKIRFNGMMETMIIKSRKYTFLDTLGAFGGLGGLLLGASVVSLVESMFLVADLMAACRGCIEI